MPASAPKKRQRPEEHARYIAHGCKQWVVSARELENGLVGALTDVRSEGYEEQIKNLILARDTHRQAADEAVLRARAEVRELEDELAGLVKTISLTAGDDERLKERLGKEAEPGKPRLARSTGPRALRAVRGVQGGDLGRGLSDDCGEPERRLALGVPR